MPIAATPARQVATIHFMHCSGQHTIRRQNPRRSARNISSMSIIMRIQKIVTISSPCRYHCILFWGASLFCGGGRLPARRSAAGDEAFQPVDGVVALLEGGFLQDAGVQRQGGLDADDDEFG